MANVCEYMTHPEPLPVGLIIGAARRDLALRDEREGVRPPEDEFAFKWVDVRRAVSISDLIHRAINRAEKAGEAGVKSALRNTRAIYADVEALKAALQEVQPAAACEAEHAPAQ